MSKDIKSDNGPPFNSHKFEEYSQEEGFKYWKVTTGWAEANGDVERFMQRIKKTARIAALEGKPVRDEVRMGVRAYKATEHATTGVSPNKLMFARELRGKFPEVKRQPKHPDDTVIRDKKNCPSYIKSKIKPRCLQLSTNEGNNYPAH